LLWKTNTNQTLKNMKKSIFIIILWFACPALSYAQVMLEAQGCIGFGQASQIISTNSSPISAGKQGVLGSFAGKVGYTKHLRNSSLNFALAYQIRENAMQVAIANKQISLPYYLQTIGVHLRPALNLGKRVAVTFPLQFGQTYFQSMENSTLTFYKNRFKSIENEGNARKTNVLSYAGGISLEVLLTDKRSPVGIKIGFEATYERLWDNTMQALQLSYTLDGETYNNVTLKNGTQSIFASCYVRVLFGKIKTPAKRRSKQDFNPRPKKSAVWTN
jgi:hypothetical protein